MMTRWIARRTGKQVLAIALAALALVACAPGRAAMREGTPTVASPSASAQVAATASRLPAVTPVPTLIAATASAVPTATATATIAPTRTPVPTATATETRVPWPRPRLVGWSANGLTIEGFTFGDGPQRLVVVGGIHGGYEWNTVLLAYELIDHYSGYPDLIPPELSLTIIPAANPDGVQLVTGTHGRFLPADVAAPTEPGRFNGSGVDINRNWDCEWQPTSIWRGQSVSAGASPFSEAESYYLREFILQEAPKAVIFLHSAVPGIFLGGCDGVVLPASRELAGLYANASGYPLPTGGFTAYPVTGDASDYLARIGVPAFTVELNNHEDTDFEQNLAGVSAVIARLSEWAVYGEWWVVSSG
jgi:predicted deacylase